MDLLQLQYFQKVAKLRHLTRAAEELHITQPALSQTIARLEKDLGVPLFSRQGRQIQLNSYGETFLAKVDIALQALDEGTQEIRDLAGLERGSISIDSSSLPYFPEAMQSFRHQYPEVQFHITHVMTKEMKEQLLSQGKIDLCISCAKVRHTGVYNHPLQTEEVFLAVPKTHHLASKQEVGLADVSTEPFIQFKKGHSFRDETDEYCLKAGFVPNIVCEVDDSQTTRQLLELGVGITFWLESMITEDSPFHHLRIVDPICLRTSYVSWSEQHYRSLAARTFCDWLVEHVANETSIT